MRLIITTLALTTMTIGLVACGPKDAETNAVSTAAQTEANTTAEESVPEMAVTLQSVVDNSALRGDRAARDQFRHPVATLEFFGLEPGMTVVEAYPGGGWYTDIIAPYLASGGGTLYAAGFDPDSERDYFRRNAAKFSAKYVGKPEIYGNVQATVLALGDFKAAPDGVADLALTFRNMHSWRNSGMAEDSFVKIYATLKPGGIMGVVAHRLPETTEVEGDNTWGYTKESAVITMAKAAGFELVERSQINANPKDIADYVSGVQTLPPVSRIPDPLPEGFDAAYYKAIGESDRMTLKFRKPEFDGALLE